MDPLIERAHRLIADRPGIGIELHFGQPALKVTGKALANLCREPGALAVWCPLELKAMLVEAAPELFFDTDHFRNWPAILVHMDRIDDDSLRARLIFAWESRAPKKMLRAWRQDHPDEGP